RLECSSTSGWSASHDSGRRGTIREPLWFYKGCIPTALEARAALKDNLPAHDQRTRCSGLFRTVSRPFGATLPPQTNGDPVVNIYSRLLGAALLLPFALAACQKKSEPTAELLANPAAVNQERLLKGLDDGTAWATYGGSYSEQRFSPLKAVNTENVSQLGLAWYADYENNLDQHGTPLYIDGVLYTATAFPQKVFAFDARTGNKLWEYNTQVDGSWLRNVCCGNINRGIAAWNGNIYVGTLDARLIAIDAKTGELAWSTDTIIGDREDPLNRLPITIAPCAAKGKRSEERR